MTLAPALRNSLCSCRTSNQTHRIMRQHTDRSWESTGTARRRKKWLLQFILTCFRVFLCGFRGPGASLHVASLLQGKDKPSIADHHLSCAEALQNSLLKWKNGSLSARSSVFSHRGRLSNSALLPHAGKAISIFIGGLETERPRLFQVC